MSVAVGVRTQRQMNDLRQSQLSRVLYWRFFLNLGLMLCDAVMFILAGVAVLNVRGEMGHLQAARLNLQFNGAINDALYMVSAALAWIVGLYYAGVYHRHVMGDGYQLNLLLFKGMVLSWIALCAVNFVIGLNLTLGGLTLTVFVGWLFTMMSAWSRVCGSPRGDVKVRIHTAPCLSVRRKASAERCGSCASVSNSTTVRWRYARFVQGKMVASLPIPTRMRHDDRLKITGRKTFRSFNIMTAIWLRTWWTWARRR